MDEKVGVTFFCWSFFVPCRRKILWANLSVFQKCSGTRSFLIIRVSQFCRNFLSHSTEKIRMGTLVFRKYSGIEKFLDDKVSRFCRTFLSHGAEVFVMIPSKTHKNWATHKLYAKKRSSTIFRGKVLVAQYRKNSRGTLSYFRKFLVRKKFMDKEGGVTFFCWLFCPKSPKNIVGEPFCVSEMFWYQKFLDIWSITILSNFFVSHHQKSSWRKPVCVSDVFWFQNMSDYRGITTLSIVVVSQCRKCCGEPSNGSKKLGQPRFLCIIGEFHDFPWKTFSLTVATNFVGEPGCVSGLF